MVESGSKRGKGRILRVKEGYNPNSSSIGSIVFALPVSLLAVTIGFGVLSGIIAAHFLKKAGKEKDGKHPGEPANHPHGKRGGHET